MKKVFVSRDEVNKELRKRFDEDKGNKKMQQSELVLKKFGLLDRDFQLRPFLLSLLTEQIAGFLRQQDQDDEPAGLGADRRAGERNGA